MAAEHRCCCVIPADRRHSWCRTNICTAAAPHRSCWMSQLRGTADSSVAVVSRGIEWYPSQILTAALSDPAHQYTTVHHTNQGSLPPTPTSATQKEGAELSLVSESPPRLTFSTQDLIPSLAAPTTQNQTASLSPRSGLLNLKCNFNLIISQIEEEANVHISLDEECEMFDVTCRSGR